MKEQIEAAYKSDVLSYHVTAMRDGSLTRPFSLHLAARSQPLAPSP